jgi:hypothetical protein
MVHLVKEPELEAQLIEEMSKPNFPLICGEYEKLLSQLGNVDGNEIIALVLIAINNVD